MDAQIKIKFSGDNDPKAKELNAIAFENKKDALKKLYEKLSSTDSEAQSPKTLCTKIKTDNNKFLLATQGAGDVWDFSEGQNSDN